MTGSISGSFYKNNIFNLFKSIGYQVSGKKYQDFIIIPDTRYQTLIQYKIILKGRINHL